MLNSYVDTFVESMTFDNCKNNIPTVTTIILLDVSLEIYRRVIEKFLDRVYFFFFCFFPGFIYDFIGKELLKISEIEQYWKLWLLD